MTDILTRIDDTLTYHSAGLNADLEVSVERPLDLTAFLATNVELADWQRAIIDSLPVGRLAIGWGNGRSPLVGYVSDIVFHSSARGFSANFVIIIDELPPFKTAAERKAEAARRSRLRHIHHQYRQRRRKW